LEKHLSKDFDEENIDKIFQEMTNKLDATMPSTEEINVNELSIKDLLLMQRSLIDALGFINQLIFSVNNEADFLTSEEESTKYVQSQVSDLYKLLEDFNDYMIEFLGEDIEFIFDFDDDEEEDDDDTEN
jgi:hypothetical protein